MTTAPATVRSTPEQHGPTQQERAQVIELIAAAQKILRPVSSPGLYLEPSSAAALIDFLEE